MGLEIERTFLVDRAKLPTLPAADTIEQGFLSDDPVVRVRLRNTKALGPKAFLTVKGPGLIERDEYEWEIPVKDAAKILEDGLWHHALVKKRYRVGRWEIDEFLGTLEGLWLAEIELTSLDEPIDLPEWLGREVTECPEYTNVALARDGLPDADSSFSGS